MTNEIACRPFSINHWQISFEENTTLKKIIIIMKTNNYGPHNSNNTIMFFKCCVKVTTKYKHSSWNNDMNEIMSLDYSHTVHIKIHILLVIKNTMLTNLGSLSKAVNFRKELHITFTSDNTCSVEHPKKSYWSNHSCLAMGDRNNWRV